MDVSILKGRVSEVFFVIRTSARSSLQHDSVMQGASTPNELPTYLQHAKPSWQAHGPLGERSRLRKQTSIQWLPPPRQQHR